MVEWVQKIKNDHNHALKEIYSLHRNECISWLKRHYPLSDQDAVDVFQLSIMILYDNVCQDKIKSDHVSLKSFLYSIAKNKAMETIRKHKETISVEQHSAFLSFIADEVPEIQNEEQLSLAIRTLEELGHPCSTIIQLFYFHNLNMEEITQKMGYNNANTTKNQKYKCLQRLQKLYFGHLKSDK